MSADAPELALGLDAGGSFTDAVVMDLGRRKVLAYHKAPTTQHDLLLGLMEALEGLRRSWDGDLSDIGLVGLSTTLATNSILEGHGGRVGLIGIGWRPRANWVLSADRAVYVSGGHDVKGRPQAALDRESVLEAARSMGHMVDALVVSSKFSVYNPSHELEASRIAREVTGLPVTAVHTLSAELGVRERTVTACLNARLIPIIDRFLTDVEALISGFGIRASIMVLRSDGGMMNLETARERPVDTILSGPAASALGGGFLAGLDECAVIDLGSTSTDIALLRHGSPLMSEGGVTVGEWATHVRAVDVRTVGLGSESVIGPDMSLGPERAVPLCRAAMEHPAVAERLFREQVWDLLLPSGPTTLPPGREGRVLSFVQDHGPCTLEETVSGLSDVYLVRETVERLLARDLLVRTTVTPTDILHHLGRFIRWDRPSASLGVEALAIASGMTPDELSLKVLHQMVDRLGEELLTKLLMESTGLREEWLSPIAKALSRRRCLGDLSLRAKVHLPVVGIGASAPVFMPSLSDRIGSEIVIPAHGEVGNAVGCICGQVTATVSVLVRRAPEGGYLLTSALVPAESYMDAGMAMAAARELAAERARSEAVASGAVNVQIEIVTTGTVHGDPSTDSALVTARAIGDPERRS